MNVGIHTMAMAEYLSLQALSSGVCHTLLTQSPAHAWSDSPWNPNRERDDSNTADLGSYAHAMLLEGAANFASVDAKDWRTKAAQEARYIARADGLIPILTHQIAEVETMVAVAQGYIAKSELAGLFDDGKPEQTLIWTETHDAGEVLCKARPDWLSERWMLHYKTTTNVNPRAFSRLAGNMGYDMALMFYLRGLNEILPDNEVNHFILAQEQTAPYACKLFDLTAARADVAERQVERAIGVWARCLASGRFPAYDGSVHSIDLQPWELAQAEEDMLTDDELSSGIPA